MQVISAPLVYPEFEFKFLNLNLKIKVFTCYDLWVGWLIGWLLGFGFGFGFLRMISMNVSVSVLLGVWTCSSKHVTQPSHKEHPNL